MNVQEMVEVQQIKYKHDTHRPTSISFCPNIVNNIRIGCMYTEEIGMFSTVPAHLSEAECIKCVRDGNRLHLVYRNSEEIQKFIEGGRKYVVSGR